MDLQAVPVAVATVPPSENMVKPAVSRIDGKKSIAAAIKTNAAGVPIGTWVGLSLCALNFMIEAIAKPNPAMYEPAVISFESWTKLL